MRAFILVMVGLLLGSSVRSAAADRFDFRRGFEVEAGASVGGAVVEWVDPSEGSTTRTGALNAFVRVRHSRMPFAFEQTIVLPHGTMSAILLDAWRADRWRAHLDLGVFIPVGGRQISTTVIDRPWDLVLGLGAEAMVYKRLTVTVDWRVFLADPAMIPGRYGDFVRPIYKEAQRGGQLWIGAGWVF